MVKYKKEILFNLLICGKKNRKKHQEISENS